MDGMGLAVLDARLQDQRQRHRIPVRAREGPGINHRKRHRRDAASGGHPPDPPVLPDRGEQQRARGLGDHLRRSRADHQLLGDRGLGRPRRGHLPALLT
ncbi:hypothetical protein SCOCK_180161 [Actinacidiphila cocklensis]|uniref:Uncharacterized protein n=1 Tax=Actinacidiphila cocklensis TaxID=887465 RepID=A0A9W4DMB0_9ACTN|nr:hypothetical protein SCOCK_180161 [Actinacidiphila cocklensis]